MLISNFQLFSEKQKRIINEDIPFYSKNVIKLGSTLTDFEVHVVGNTLKVVTCPIEVLCKINSRHNPQIDFRKTDRFKAPFDRLYLTTTTTSSDDLEFLVSTLADFDFKSEYESVGIRDPSGNDIDPRDVDNVLVELDSSQANITNGNSYTLAYTDVSPYSVLGFGLYADQDLDVEMQWSDDGTNQIAEYAFTQVASDLTPKSIENLFPYLKVVISNNSGSDTTSLRFQLNARRIG